MYKSLIFTITIGFIFCLNVDAQQFSPATREQQQTMQESIAKSSADMNSLICDFEQVKELTILNEKMISKGKMYYRNDSRLRWEYQSPYFYTFLLNNNKILMKTESSQNVVDVKSSRLFQEIVRIMMSSINGTGLIDDSKSFTSTYHWGERECQVIFVPVSKELKKMFSTIKLTFNKNDYTVDKVEMEEQSGGTTVIKLTQKRFNEIIEDEKFAID